MLVKVEAYHDGTFWCARGIREDVFTQGKTLDELLKNVKEAAVSVRNGIAKLDLVKRLRG